jgi:hypothetical protein
MTIDYSINNAPEEDAFDNELPTEQTAPISDEDAEINSFIDSAEDNDNIPDPMTVVTLRTSGGDTRYVPVTGSMTAGEVFAASGLAVSGVMQIWLNGVQIANDTVVPAGSTLTLVGSIKGGAL